MTSPLDINVDPPPDDYIPKHREFSEDEKLAHFIISSHFKAIFYEEVCAFLIEKAKSSNNPYMEYLQELK